MMPETVPNSPNTLDVDVPVCAEDFIHPDKVATATRGRVPSEHARLLAETFKVLGDPTRVRILDLLSRGELCVCDLSTILELSQSAVSHQLRLLRMHRLVRSRRDGRVVFYSLDDNHIVRLFSEALDHVSHA